MKKVKEIIELGQEQYPLIQSIRFIYQSAYVVTNNTAPVTGMSNKIEITDELEEFVESLHDVIYGYDIINNKIYCEQPKFVDIMIKSKSPIDELFKIMKPYQNGFEDLSYEELCHKVLHQQDLFKLGGNICNEIWTDSECLLIFNEEYEKIIKDL